MKKSEFKEIIKESVKEVLVEEGVLKNVISEVLKATEISKADQGLDQTKQFLKKDRKEVEISQKQKLSETKKKMLDAIGKSSYGGVDLFEGTTPLSKAGTTSTSPSPSSALEGVDPNDSGVDISGLLGNSNVWKELLK
tara:strand:- start:785 stop:1198 length:414 start_codon:yes stop_codon:yes gene_type:complete